MKKIFYLLISFGFLLSYGQGENNYWYFGSALGLNFNNGASTTNPVPVYGSSTGFLMPPMGNNGAYCNQYSTVSDNQGNLLFYSDGLKVYNKLHSVMSGSPTLNNSNLLGGFSGSRQSIIVPFPGNSKKYYLFSTGSPIAEYMQYKYTMTVIDFTNNSLGEIISHNTNFMQSQTSEGFQAITATYNSNMDGYLLFIPKGKNSSPDNANELLVFSITSSGVSLITQNQLDFDIRSYSGVKVSNSVNNPKICISNVNHQVGVNAKTKVYNFNRANGVISSSPILEITKKVNSFEFSSNDNLLYAMIDVVGGGHVVDYRLVVYDLNNIGLGYRVLSNSPILGGIQKGINGEIYFSDYNYSSTIFKIDNQNSWSLSSISSQTILCTPSSTTTINSFVDFPQLVTVLPVNNSEECQSITLSSESNTGVYTYQNYSDITTQTNYNLNLATQDITMKAEDFIVLKPNSHIKANSKFWAKIQPCEGAGRTSESTIEFQDIKNNDVVTNQEDLEIYPNPTDTEFNINSKNEIIKLTIFSLEGKLVFEKDYNNLKQITTNVSELNNGLYFVNIYYKNGQQVIQKLIKK